MNGFNSQRSWLVGIALLAILTTGSGQSIENVVATVRENLITVEYDFNPGSETSRYKIQLFTSHNNFAAPLALVSGAVGEVEGGGRKTITWAARSELVNYSGDLSFEVRGEPIVAVKPLSFASPVTGASVKRGKNLSITWIGGAKGESVQLKLMQDGAVKQDLGKQPNTGSLDWSVPKKTPKGTYQVSIASATGNAMSMPFKIKPKTGAFIKIFPVILAGAAVYFLIGGNDGPESPPTDTKLPTPPDPN